MNILKVTCGVLERDNKFFCAFRNANQSMAGKVEFPGGKIELNETPEECVIRELREELGVDAKIVNKILVLEHDYPNMHLVLYVFLCKLVDETDEPRILEHARGGWYTLEELQTLPWDPCDINIIDYLKNTRH